jgi:hypothetical protein
LPGGALLGKVLCRRQRGLLRGTIRCLPRGQLSGKFPSAPFLNFLFLGPLFLGSLFLGSLFLFPQFLRQLFLGTLRLSPRG